VLNDTVVQIGSDSSSCLVFEDFDKDEIVFIKSLFNIAVYDSSGIDRVTKERKRYIFEELGNAGFLMSRIENTQKRRANASVAITRLDKLSVSLCIMLANAGVGTIYVPDSKEVVSQVDISPFSRGEFGKQKLEAIRRIIKSYDSKSKISTSFEKLPDCVFTCFYNNYEVDICTKLLHEGIPHFPVLLRTNSAFVGPHIAPAVSLCLKCLKSIFREEDTMKNRYKTNDIDQMCFRLEYMYNSFDFSSVNVDMIAAIVSSRILDAIDSAGRISYNAYTQMTIIREPGSSVEVRTFSKQQECECSVYDMEVKRME
jgi:hypothetical protein